MDATDSMCEFRGTKQKAFNEACCAFANSENMTELANRLGINPTMLRNKLNPEQPHVLVPVELIALTKASDNHTILNSLLLGIGVVTAKVPSDASEEILIKRALINKAHSTISNLVALVSDVENRTSGITPFLSMGVDFIV